MAAPGGGITFTKNSMGLALALVCSMSFPLSAGFAGCPPDCFSRQFSIQRMALSYNSLTTFLHVEADHHSRNEEVGKLIMSVR